LHKYRRSLTCERRNTQSIEMNGYMTVEASFIVPWVVFLIIWIIYTGYFEYNRCLAFQDNYTLATQTAAKIDTNENKQNWLTGKLSGSISNKYMGISGYHNTAQVTWNNIQVSSEMNTVHPFSFAEGMIPGNSWRITDTVNADNYSFTERIRTFRTVGRIVSER